MSDDNLYVRVPKIVLIFLMLLAGIGSAYIILDQREQKPRIEFGPMIVESKLTDDMLADKEEVKCEFEEPITVVVSVFHYYDNYEDLNRDYTEWYDVDPDEEIWGFSDCEWQPENNYSACDIYTVHPEFVVADMAMDTIGHEVYHGSCGDFHK